MKRPVASFVLLLAAIGPAYQLRATRAKSPSGQEASEPAAAQAGCGVNGAASCGPDAVAPTSIQANATVMAAAQEQAAITGYYNVRSFGALGTGKADDTAAVQAAINTACKSSAQQPYGGVTLYFPAGFYAVHGLQVICGNLLLEGAGPGATELQYDGPQNSGPYPATPSSSAYIVEYMRGMADGGLRDMTLMGFTNLEKTQGVATDLLVVEWELDSQAVFQNLGFAHAIHDGIHLINPAPAFNPATMGGARGYATANNVPTTGGSGKGMRVNITASGGRVATVRIIAQGDGYQTGDTITVAQPGSSRDASFVLGAGSSYVNWFMRQIRWDGIGRYCIHMDGLIPGSGHPFALYGFTWANPTGGAAGEWLSANGYIQGPWVASTTPWSQGLIGFTGAVGYGAAIYDGRLEGTEPQIAVGPGQEGNLFVTEMPTQPSITLHVTGGSVSSLIVNQGGYGWTANHVTATYRGCTRSPNIAWVVSSGVVVDGIIHDGGACAADAAASLFVSGGNTFTAQNITGFISAKYRLPLIYSASGEDGFKLDNISISGLMGDYMNGRSGALSIAGSLTSIDRLSYGQGQNGWSTQGHSFLSVDKNDIQRENISVKAGDILFHDASDYQARPLGQIGAYQIITYPIHGYTMLRQRTNLCEGNLTPAGNTWSGCTPAQLRAAQVSVNAALTFPAGGASSASLDTYVTAVDWSTGTMTTATAGAAASTVDFTTPQWRDSWATGSSYPTSPDEIYYQGEVIYNSTPAPGQPISWSCAIKICKAGSGWIDGPPYGNMHGKP